MFTPKLGHSHLRSLQFGQDPKSAGIEQPPSIQSAKETASKILTAPSRDTVMFGRKVPLQISQTPAVLQESMVQGIETVYGQERAAEIRANLERILDTAKTERLGKSDLLREDYNRPWDWYKNEVGYVFYADRMGVGPDGKPTTFRDVTSMLDYLQSLGVTTLYALPFLDSPEKDAGFDVSHYTKVRGSLGGDEEFNEFLQEANRRGFKVMMDAVLNHCSDQHEWFQQALAGDAAKRDYFVWSDKPPVYTRRMSAEGPVTDYVEPDGRISSRRLIFPHASEHNWRETEINGKKVYFYHTFYPEQPDLNWQNPEVLYQAAEILAHWANKGIDIFRLDALPFLIKKPGTNAENLKETHAVIQTLSAFLQALAPQSVLLAEANQSPSEIRPYYGEEKQYSITVPGHGVKDMQRSSEVQMTYDFTLMPAIWASMIAKKAGPVWEAMEAAPAIPDSAARATFIRNHDELTLEMVKDDIRTLIYDATSPNGEGFRDGYGVSGRLAALLGRDARRITLMKSVLMSLPGVPNIYYGDETGADNSPEFMHEVSTRRGKLDTRDLHRAPHRKDHFQQAMASPDSFEGKVYQAQQRMISIRKTNDAINKGNVTPVTADRPQVLSYVREFYGQRVLVVHNLSEQSTDTTLTLPDSAPVSEAPAKPKDLLSQTSVALNRKSNNQVGLKMEPYQTYWLQLADA